MQQKIVIYSLRIFAIIFLMLSFLLLVAVRLSDKGDVIDRNTGWILLIFLIASGTFIYTFFILGGALKNIDKSKTTDELRNEISKLHLDKLKDSKNQAK